MAKSVGSLFATLKLDSTKFQSGISGAISSLTGLNGKVALAGAAVAGMATAAGVAAFALAKHVANTGDEFQKMSLRLGVSTEKLSALSHAASLSGTDIGTVETGLRLLSKRMHDADSGLADAKQSFESLGIKTKTATGELRASDEVMLELADKLANMKDQTRATALAQEFFGRSGTQLLPMLKSGSAGIKEMTDEAKALGIVWSKEDTDAAALFNDNMDRLHKTFTGVKDTVGKALIPVFNELADAGQKIGKQVVEWVQANRDLIQQNVTSFVLDLADALLSVADVVVRLPVHWAALNVSVNRGISVALAATRAYFELDKALWSVLEVTNLINPADWLGITDMGGYARKNIEFARQTIKSLDGIKDAADEDLGALMDKLSDAQDGSDKLRDVIQGIRDRLKEVGAGATETAKPMSAFWESTVTGGKKGEEATERNTHSFGKLDKAIAKASEAAKVYARITGTDVANAEKELSKIVDEAGKTAVDSWESQYRSRDDVQSRTIQAMIEREELLHKIEEEEAQILEDRRKDYMKTLATSNNFFDGLKLGWLHVREKAVTWSQSIADTFVSNVGSMRQFWSEGFASAIKGDFGGIADAFDSLVDNIVSAWIDMLANMLNQWAISGIGRLFGLEVTAGGSGGGGGVSGVVQNAASNQLSSALTEGGSAVWAYLTGGGVSGSVGGGVGAGVAGSATVEFGAGAAAAGTETANAASVALLANPAVWAALAGGAIALDAMLGDGVLAQTVIQTLDSVAGPIGNALSGLFGGGGVYALPAGAQNWVSWLYASGKSMGEIASMTQNLWNEAGYNDSGIYGGAYGIPYPSTGEQLFDLFSNPDSLRTAASTLGYESFARGIGYVPYDMLANVHQGERIVKADDNAEMMELLRSLTAYQAQGGGATVVFNGPIYDGERTTRMIHDELERYNRRLH